MVIRNPDVIVANLRAEKHDPTQDWTRYCLKLQRTVRDIDPLFLTANAAMMATPPQYQVRKISELQKGMVAFSADFNDSNLADHVYGIGGKLPDTERITWSNDVREAGQVDAVRLSFYQRYWGDAFQFGSWWLNGVYFGPVEHEKPKIKLGQHYENVLHSLIKIRNVKAKSDKPGAKRLAELLTEDIKTMRDNIHNWSD